MRSGCSMVGRSGRRCSIRLSEYKNEAQKGARNEQGTSTGVHTQGRVRPDIGRKALTVGCQRPALWGLGDLSRQGIPRGPEPAVRIANQWLVRADYSAVR